MGHWAKPNCHGLKQEQEEGLGLEKVAALHFGARIGGDTQILAAPSRPPLPRVCGCLSGLIKRVSCP